MPVTNAKSRKQGASAPARNIAWLIFIPQLPSSPSSLRVLVWRRMRAAGAAALQQSVWVLPQTPGHERFLQELWVDVRRQGGTGVLLAASTLDSELESEIAERFREDRNQEYREFSGRCRDFLEEIRKETAVGNLSFAELEENEEDFSKLQGWLKKIEIRDFFGAQGSIEAAADLETCQRALEAFAEAVYAREGLET